MSFGQFLWDLVAIWVWVVAVFVWVFAIFDVFRRRDLGGWARALWLLVIVFLPVFGTFVYLIFRPFGREPSLAELDAKLAAAPVHHAAEDLKVISDLLDAGKITQAEFDAVKARILSSAS